MSVYGSGPPRLDGRPAPVNDRGRHPTTGASPEPFSYTTTRALNPPPAAAQARLRRQRDVERIVGLAPSGRLVFELLDELDRHHQLGDDLDRRLARYAALDPALLRFLGGDKFPAAPIHLVAMRPP